MLLTCLLYTSRCVSETACVLSEVFAKGGEGGKALAEKAVSYTHLDVYKRQLQMVGGGLGRVHEGDVPAHVPAYHLFDEGVAVSYTHLRQPHRPHAHGQCPRRRSG